MKGILNDWKIHDFEEVQNTQKPRRLSIASILVRHIYGRLRHYGATRLAHIQHYQSLEQKRYVKSLRKQLRKKYKSK